MSPQRPHSPRRRVMLLLIALVGLAASLAAFMHVQRTSEALLRIARGPRPDRAAMTARVEMLQAELAAVQGLLEGLRTSKRPPPTTPAPTNPAAREDRERLETLIVRIEELEALLIPEDPVQAAVDRLKPEFVQAQREAIERTIATALDPTMSDSERTLAVENLRGCRPEDLAADYYPRLVRWLPNLTDEALATRVARALDARDHEGIRNWYLDRLRNGRTRRLREQVADGLATVREQPEVERALRDASRDDPDARVRKEAIRALRD